MSNIFQDEIRLVNKTMLIILLQHHAISISMTKMSPAECYLIYNAIKLIQKEN